MHSEKIKSFNSKCLFLAIVKQRDIEDSIVIQPFSTVIILKNVLSRNVGISFDENDYSEINSLSVIKIEDFINYDDYIFGIKLITKQNKDNVPIYVSIAFSEQINAFLMVQGSRGRLLSSKSLEIFINHLFSKMQIEESDGQYTCFVRLNKHNKATTNLKQEQIQNVLYNVVESEIRKKYNQISLFELEKSPINYIKSFSFAKAKYSKDVYNDFAVNKSFIGFHVDMLEMTYKVLSTIVPKEVVQFTQLPIEHGIVCEMICSAICHQMNWEFLRSAILKKTLFEPNWIDASNLATIQTEEVEDLFDGYDKIERIRAEERAKLLRALGATFADFPRGFNEIFFREDRSPQVSLAILSKLSLCSVFTNDPVEKKVQLLLQKLSTYKGFEDVGNICKPTIDYHIIRSFLRRGFLVPKTKYAREFVTTDAIRTEQTVGAIRKHCTEIINLLSKITGQSIATVNNIEWWIGRSVCIENCPLCDLETKESEWLFPYFNVCPFKKVFCYSLLNGKENIQYSAPNYQGNSY